MIFIDDLQELSNRSVFYAWVSYVSVQPWGTFVSCEGDVCKSHAEAEEWIERQRRTRAVIHANIQGDRLPANIDPVRQQCVDALRTEKSHCQQKMQEELEKYDDRIEKLLAITHQPKPDPSIQPMTDHERMLAAKKEYLEAVLEHLTDNRDIVELTVLDEEGYETTLGDGQILWATDDEVYHINYANGDKISLFILWENGWDELVSDYSYKSLDQHDSVVAAMDFAYDFVKGKYFDD